jgi:hypothetical protein
MKHHFSLTRGWIPAVCACLLTSLTQLRGELVSVNTITNNASTIGIFFDVPVTLPSATNPSNYFVHTKTGTFNVTGVTLQTNGQLAALTLPSNIGEFFYVEVTNVVDIASNSLAQTLMGYISDYGSTDVGTIGDPSPAGEVFTALNDAFEVTASGSDVGGLDDHFHFVYREVVGDFDMAVRVTQLEATTPQSKAGLMARETLTEDSATIQTYFTPIAGSNEVEVAVRSITGGTTTDSGFQIGPRAAASSNEWLRLTRSGNLFSAYHGTNGVNWTFSGSTTQAFASTLNVGMMVTSQTNGATTTASFNSFGVLGAKPGDATIPSLSASLSGTDVALEWLRTPNDFTVEVSTNLLEWSLLLAPIFETGSNNVGRLMLVPMDLFGNTFFARLVKVQRVIPDPPLVLQTGLILSVASGNLTGASDTTLCSYSVTNAIAQTSMTAVPGKTVTFTTIDSSTPLDTVLKVRRLPDLVPPCDDNSAGNLKARQIYSTTTTRTNFTLVTAVKPATPTSPTLAIQVRIIIQ